MTQKLYEAEIVRLHEFFSEWFTASIPQEPEEFQKVSNALATEFHLISPKGAMTSQVDLLANLQKAYGCFKDSSKFQIDIRNCRCLWEQRVHQQSGDTIESKVVTLSMWTYEEWQTMDSNDGTKNPTETARISTALFRRTEPGDGNLETHLEWMHVHETWMPGKGLS